MADVISIVEMATIKDELSSRLPVELRGLWARYNHLRDQEAAALALDKMTLKNRARHLEQRLALVWTAPDLDLMDGPDQRQYA